MPEAALPDPPDAELLAMLKALADGSRLKIIGLLAHGPLSVERLAAGLGLGMSTTSHHLKRLSQAGLVEARAQGHYSLYRLRDGAVDGLAQRLLRRQPEGEPPLAARPGAASPEARVLHTFTDGAGRITAFPKQQKKLLVLLRHVLEAFEPGQRYPEREVNARLARYSDDTATLRRGLVEHGLMQREGGGGAYWRS